jgi:hypothetical protein
MTPTLPYGSYPPVEAILGLEGPRAAAGGGRQAQPVAAVVFLAAGEPSAGRRGVG